MQLRRMASLGAILGAALGLAASASAQVLDFQHLEQNNNQVNNVGNVVTEDGFEVTKAPGEPFEFAVFGTQENRYPGSTALFNNTVNGLIKITKIGGGTFDVATIDFAMLNGGGSVTINLTGTHPDNTTVQQQIVHNDAGFPLDLVTYALNGFTNLVSIEWTQQSPFHQFDNVVIRTCGRSTINFEELGQQPCLFNQTQPLSTEYSGRGVVFQGPQQGEGGAILDQCSNFGVNARSGTHFLAFNSATYAKTPETIHFRDGCKDVEVFASPGSQSGNVTITAFNRINQIVDVQSAQLVSGQYIRLFVSGNIDRVVIDTTSPWLLLDDLTWTPHCQFGLAVTGQCPGTIRVSWSNARPNVTLALIFAANTGNFVIPFGPCQGVTLGLGNQAIRLVRTLPSGSGNGTISGNAGSGACRRFLQMHDLPGCNLSNVAQIP